MKLKVLLFVLLLFMGTVISAFLMAASSSEEEELTNLSKELETARQKSLDEDLDSLEESLKKEDPFLEKKKAEPPKEESVVEEKSEAEEPVAEPQEAQEPREEAAEEIQEESRPQEPRKEETHDAKVSLDPEPMQESPEHWGLTLMGGAYRPQKYVGQGDRFNDIYTGEGWVLQKNGFWGDLALEWKILKSIGKLGLKASTGIWYIQGKNDARTDATTAQINYTMMAIPLFGGAVYRLQYWSKQPLVPFVEGAYGGFHLRQTQGASGDRYAVNRPAYLWGLGLQINGNILDPEAGRDFDIEHGVNRTHFVAQLRHINSQTTDEFDFSGQNLITGGFLFEF